VVPAEEKVVLRPQEKGLSSSWDGGSGPFAHEATSPKAATTGTPTAGRATTAATAACGTDTCIASTASSGGGTKADVAPTGPVQLRHRCGPMADKMGAKEKGLVLQRAPLALPQTIAGEATTSGEATARGEATSSTNVGGSNTASHAADSGATANREHHATKLPDRPRQLANRLVARKT